jgi:hypothetical protein
MQQALGLLISVRQSLVLWFIFACPDRHLGSYSGPAYRFAAATYNRRRQRICSLEAMHG